MPFKEITGQEQAVAYLRRSLERGRIAHALLFTGPDGVGKRATALSLAQALNCPEPKDGDACGACPSCRKIAAGTHPDVRVLEPEGQHLKIGQVREQLQQDAAFKPLEGKAKVYILDAAETLTAEAANSLLKVLEEPPATVKLVLVTSQPFALLDTIRSRCQEVRFHPLKVEYLTDWLHARLQCPPETARTLAMLSGGRPAEALRFQTEEQQALRRQVLDAARAVGSESWPELARRLGESASELPEVFGLLLTWYRDLLILASGASTKLIINVDQLAELQQARAGETAETLLKKCEAVLQAADQFSRNVNAQLLLEVMCMNLGKQAA